MARRLRVLGVIDSPTPLIGGAQISMAILLGQLRRVFGHDCKLVGPSAQPGASRAYGIAVRGLHDLEELAATITHFNPDVIVSALDGSIPAAAFASQYRIPHVVWAHSFEWTPPTRAERRLWRVSDERVYPAPDERRRVLTAASAILANSRYTQARLRERAGVSSVVVYPGFEVEDYVVRRDDDGARRFVTAVAGYGYKGADIVLGLAEAMPDVLFQLVGRIVEPWRGRAAALPNVTLTPFMPAHEYLATSGVVLVPSQWPEPFGRVAAEALANGIPTIVSRTGGLTECARGAVFVREFRSLAAWHHALEGVLKKPGILLGEAPRFPVSYPLTRSERSRLRVSSPQPLAVAHRVLSRVARRRKNLPRRPIAVLTGDADARTAFAMINAHWMAARSTGRVTLVAPNSKSPDRDIADVHVRHDFSRDFTSWPLPSSGRAIAVRTWDFGPYPRAWAEVITRDYDQLWVGTRWIRRQALASGIAADRIKVVPLGVDSRVFSPRGTRYPLPAPARFTFLFVGAPIARKGFDVLLRAYLAGFRRGDPVRLVIKANPDDVFYAGADLRASLAAAMAEATAPEIVFVDRFLSVAELASLYRAADVCVFPYRAEGFCLPILESMACGRPVIVPKFGAALDFCSSRTSFMVPARRISVPVPRRFAINTLGFEEDIEAVDFCEVDPATLAAVMRDVATQPVYALRQKATHGLRVARRFTWEASRATAERAILAALRRPVPVRFERTRAEAHRHRRVLEAARDLYLGGLS